MSRLPRDPDAISEIRSSDMRHAIRSCRQGSSGSPRTRANYPTNRNHPLVLDMGIDRPRDSLAFYLAALAA
ncbi:hypothetical protein KC326_g129 [Hortaea werneckii]|nr:hypothetical protein KC326_g129 [Hortaea werneckii]